MKCVLVIFCSLFFTCNVIGQTYNIKGRVMNLDNTLINFINVKLFSTEEELIGQSITSAEGNFLISGVRNGNYILQFSFFKSIKKREKIAIENKDLSIGDIKLSDTTLLLDGVTVTAKTIESFANRKVFRFSEKDKKLTKNAFDLVTLIPKLQSDLNNQIKTVNGETVKILINGINSTETDLLTIIPDEVLRVEYYETPPLRFAALGIGSVLNIITKKGLKTGGTIVTNLQNALTTGFGNDLISFRYNKNEWLFGANYTMKYRKYDKRSLSESLIYNFDGKSINKDKTGNNSPYKYQDQLFDAFVIKNKKDDYVFNLNFSLNSFDKSTMSLQDIVQSTPAMTSFNSNGLDKNSYSKPVLDLYLDKKITTNQDYIVNVVGTYYKTDYYNQYNEYNNVDTLFSSSTMIKGSKYSVIADALYTYDLKKYHITTGIRYTSSYSNQEGVVTDNVKLSSDANDLFGYFELSGSYKKLKYTTSLGLSNNIFSSKELGKKYSFVYILPSIQLNYNLNSSSDLLVTYRLNTQNPSLSELSYNPVMKSDYLAYGGNPDLHPYKSHNISVSYSFQNNGINFTTDLFYIYSQKPILSYFTQKENYILQSFTNFSSAQKYGISFNAQWFPFKGKNLRFNIYGELFKNGNYINHISRSHADFRIIPTINAQFGKWNINLLYQSSTKILVGEIMQGAPSAAYAEFGFKPNTNFSFLIGVRYPFYASWKQETETHIESLVMYRSSEIIKNNANMIYFNIFYTLGFGKQNKVVKKILNNKDVDSGILNLL